MQHVARLRVERGKRLIHQQNFWPQRKRSRQRHALPHPAGQLVNVMILKMRQVNHTQKKSGTLGSFVLGHAGHFQAELRILPHRQPRK